jgi:hypothetical protein
MPSFFSNYSSRHMSLHTGLRSCILLEKAVFREYHRIVADNALLYGTDFASTNSDFFANKERRESYGCLVANMLAQQYIFKVFEIIVAAKF